MSRRKRRHSRRKSSSSTKWSHSTFAFQCHNNDAINKTSEYENDTNSSEKGTADISHREDPLKSNEIGKNEHPFHNGSKRSSQDTIESECRTRNKDKNPPPADRSDKGMNITATMNINDQEMSALGKIIVRHYQQHTDNEPVEMTISVNAPIVKCSVSGMKVEIKGLQNVSDPTIQATFTFKTQEGVRKETFYPLYKKWDQPSFPDNENPENHNLLNINRQSADLNQRHKGQKRHFFQSGGNNIHEKCKEHCEMLSKFEEDKDCYKSCCEDLTKDEACNVCNQRLRRRYSDVDYPVTDVSDSFSSLSQSNMQVTNVLRESTMHIDLGDIPPPDDFADKCVQNVTREISMCQIKDDKSTENVYEPALSDSRMHFTETRRYSSLQSEINSTAMSITEYSSECDFYDPILMDHKVPVSRKNFTKDFISKHNGRTRLRNNSIVTMETISNPALYLEKRSQRRQTFPNSADIPSKISRELLPYRESFSSDTVPSFFLKIPSSDPKEDYNEEQCECMCNALENCTEHDPFANTLVESNHAFCTSQSVDNTNNAQCDEACKANESFNITLSSQNDGDVTVVNESSCPESHQLECLQHLEFMESGFDEHILNDEDANEISLERSITNTDWHGQISPSSAFHNHFDEKVHSSSSLSEQLNGHEQSEQNAHIHVHETTTPDPCIPNRRSSVVTVIVGDLEQRILFQNDSFTRIYDAHPLSSILNVVETEEPSQEEESFNAAPPSHDTCTFTGKKNENHDLQEIQQKIVVSACNKNNEEEQISENTEELEKIILESDRKENDDTPSVENSASNQVTKTECADNETYCPISDPLFQGKDEVDFLLQNVVGQEYDTRCKSYLAQIF
ncbi:uncharacterized protein LOC120532030 [Polypterus senegalus]|uniref:uncharacterized protein LOC120532030 n=1 Tax=Polypterus senegalus TaxID=55291 RepID=UPI0019623298|nr:uncharacterized protein LOC120532030 [Polypterus senegalus]